MRTTVTLSVLSADGPTDLQVTAPASAPLGEVADALHLPAGGLHVDGIAVAPEARLIDALAPGSVIATAPPAVAPPDHRAGSVAVAVSGGLHAGRMLDLRPGDRATVGRGHCADLHVGCPTVSPHHAVVTWSPPTPSISDAGSTNGLADAAGTRQPITPLDATTEVRLGAARLRLLIEPEDRLTLPPPDERDARRVVDRPLLPPTARDAVVLPIPAGPMLVAGQSPFSWALFIGPLLIGAAMAALMSPLMAAFALLSPVMVAASWYEGRRRQRLGRRREHRRLRRELADFSLALDVQRAEAAVRRRADHPDPAEVRRRASTPARSVWARRPGHASWLQLRIGTGRVAWRPELREQAGVAPPPEVADLVAAVGHLTDVPVTVPASEVAVVGIAGPRHVTAATVRALIVDAATHHGPADLGIVIDTDRPDAWRWCRWLPHHGPLDPAADRHLLVVCDRPGPLRPGTISRTALDRRAGPTTLILAADAGSELPDRCALVVRTLDPFGTARIEAPDPNHRADEVLLDGLDADVAESTARALARLRDPEHEPSGGPPSLVRLSDLVSEPFDPSSTERRWAASDPTRLDLVLGSGTAGLRTLDLITAGPHVLVGGTTGAGKSELLRTLVASLALAHPPDHVTFVLVDYKGGSAFDACAVLPHTLGLVTDLDGRLGDRAIRSLDAEIRRRERVLRTAGHDDFAAHAGHQPALPRLVVVVDEFATLARDLPEVLDALVDVARRGRSLGIHLVLATQRPTGVISDQIRTNTNLRVALRMIDPSDSADILGDATATALPAETPGRALVRSGSLVEEVQVACVSLPAAPPGVQVRRLGDEEAWATDPGGEPTDLDTIVGATASAWAACLDAAPARADALRRPWEEPLPTHLDLADHDATGLPEGSWLIGLADDPEGQRHVPVGWHPDDGPLILFGLPGSGCTTALRAVVEAGAHRLDPTQLHVYVVGAAGEWTPAVGHLPHVGGIVEPDDPVRLDRLIDLVRSARREPPEGPRVLVVLDDVRAALDAVDRHGGVALVDEVIGLLCRPARGLAVAASADRAGAVPGALSAAAHRLCLRLAEPYDYAAFGLRPVDVRTLPPGRGFDASTGLEIQIRAAGPGAHRRAPATGRLPDTLEVLPADVRRRALPPPPPADPDTWTSVLGLLDQPRRPAVIRLDRGEHLLVTGPAGSGRSTTLAAIAVDSDAFIVSGAPRSPLRTGADTAPHWCPIDALDPDAGRRGRGPLLVLIDDADLVEDPDGRLARLVADPGRARVIAAVHNERIRSRYQHWTRPFVSARLGLALQPRADDAEIWATLFPSRPTTGWPPGRGYLHEHGRAQLIQVARP